MVIFAFILSYVLLERRMSSFISRLSAAIIATDSPLCVGLDPFAASIPPIFGDGNKVSALEVFFNEVIDNIKGKVAVIKPQIGLFEPWGAEGIALVSRLCKRAREAGLIIILDAKRGDIGTTAQGYADAYLGENPVIDCDCITLNPYMGIETLEPFMKHSQNLGKSIAVLVRTSNAGAKDFQDLLIDNEPLWVKVAKSLQPLEARLMDGDLSSLMVVIGATWPEQAKQLREILPYTQFLIPGFGAQGGSAQDALSGLINKGNRLEGGVVNSSRGILYPKEASNAKSIDEWRVIFNANLDAALSDLRDASEIVIAQQ